MDRSKYESPLTFCAVLLFVTLSFPTAVNGKECPNRPLIEKSLLDAHIPGAVVIVLNTTDILYQHAFGYQSFLPAQRMDVDKSIFVLASISKTFIALAAMQLVESDRLHLDADINQYLLPSDPRIFNPLYPSSVITLRQLLSHSASIGTNAEVEHNFFVPGDEGLTKTTLAEACFTFLTGNKSNWLSSSPGTTTEYSNFGAALAALIIERVTGMSFEDYVRNYIFGPLDIDTEKAGFWLSKIKKKEDLVRHYAYNSSNLEEWKTVTPRLNVTQLDIPNWLAIPLHSVSIYPAGLLRMSGSSLSKFLRMFMNNGDSLVHSASVTQMKRIVHAVTTDDSSDEKSPPTLEFGLVWNWQAFDDGRRFLGHTGALPGATHSMLINEKGDTGVIILTNGDVSLETDLSAKISQTIDDIQLMLFNCYEH